jgi:hypothetical protein
MPRASDSRFNAAQPSLFTLPLTDHRIRLIQPLPLDSEEGIAGSFLPNAQVTLMLLALVGYSVSHLAIKNLCRVTKQSRQSRE